MARVRENQRKSRARRQEHIRDLEQKLALHQEKAHRKDVEHKLAIQKLEAENQKLRYLLSCSGMATNTVEEHLCLMDDPIVSRKVAIPAARKSRPQQVDCSQSHVPRSLTVPDVDQIGMGQVTIADCTEQATQPLRKPTVRETRMPQVSCEHQSICGCLPRETMGSWPTSRDSLNTTLCTIADELIHQYNTRGLDIAVIRGKLWAGFSNSLAMDEGCRVHNQLLFQVLDEISL